MYVLSFIIPLISRWSWEVFSFNFILFLLILAATAFLFLSIVKSSKKLLVIFSLLLVPLLIVQWKTTKNRSFEYLDPTDERQINVRQSNVYAEFNIGKYIVNKPDYFFNKFQQNLLQSLDLNLYFFGNHPREVPGNREFEKFSFLLIPFFIYGLFKIKLSPWKLLMILIPLTELILIGLNNHLGPFILFPFIASITSIGIFYSLKNLKKRYL